MDFLFFYCHTLYCRADTNCDVLYSVLFLLEVEVNLLMPNGCKAKESKGSKALDVTCGG